MKRAQVTRGFIFLALAILISSPFVFAGFSDWWTTFTGRDTENVTNVSILIGNTGPTIYYVSPVAGQIPNEGQMIKYYVLFNASDPDGPANFNDSTAYVNFTKAGEDLRENASCEDIGDDPGTNTVTYNCTVEMEWYDSPDGATWTVYTYVQDVNGAEDTNASISMQPNLLAAWQNVQWDGIFNFAGNPSTSATDVISTDNFTINNTGNDDFVSFNATAYNLRGLTTTSEYIYAENFTMHSSWSATCAGGTAMENATLYVGIGGSALTNGNNNQEELYLCIQGFPQGITSQTYDTSHYGSWNITSQV